MNPATLPSRVALRISFASLIARRDSKDSIAPWRNFLLKDACIGMACLVEIDLALVMSSIASFVFASLAPSRIGSLIDGRVGKRS